MTESDVVYTDVKFTNGRRKVNVNSLEDSATYSEVKLQNNPPCTEPSDSRQTVTTKRSKVTAERAAVLVLGALLVAAVVALLLIMLNNKKTLKDLQTKWETENKNLTEMLSKMKACNSVTPTCPESTREPQEENCKKCDPGWKKNKVTGQCYWFSIIKKPWESSKRICEGRGGHLVKIDSAEEQRFLEKQLRTEMKELNDKFWIGLTDSETENTWKWLDGSELDPSLTYWSGAEPDNWHGSGNSQVEGEDCVRMGEKDGARDLKCWFDRYCEEPHKFICEKAATDGKKKCV